MDYFLIFVITFVIIYIFYLLLVVINNKKVNKIFDTQQAMLIIKSNNLDVNGINKRWFANAISISNSFIVAITLTVSEFFDNYIIKLIVCFLVLIISIIVVYRIIGMIYKKGR